VLFWLKKISEKISLSCVLSKNLGIVAPVAKSSIHRRVPGEDLAKIYFMHKFQHLHIQALFPLKK
jgi:hypothetical protein